VKMKKRTGTTSRRAPKAPALILIGAGGHAKVILEVLRYLDYRLLGVIDPRGIAGLGANAVEVEWLGDDGALAAHSPDAVMLLNGVGSVGSTAVRRDVFARFSRRGYLFCPIMHPSAIVASDLTFGPGTQIMAGAVIQPGCVLGDNIIINTRASIDHDCRIGDHVHVAPGVTLSGQVTIGEGAHIGTGATVIQGITIGRNVIVGAGAVVTGNVADGTTVVGVPARPRALGNRGAATARCTQARGRSMAPVRRSTRR